MDSFLGELMGEFPDVGTPTKTQNTYSDSLALYNQSRDLTTEAMRMDAGVDSIYKSARPEVKRSVFQDALKTANEFFSQYKTYKPSGYKSVRAGDRSFAVPMYPKPKGGGEVADAFLDGLKMDHPSE